MFPPRYWYCCLAFGEFNVLRGMVTAFSLTAFTFVPQVVWDGLWLTVFVSPDIRKELFAVSFELDFVELPIGSPPTLTAVVTTRNPIRWAEIALYQISPAGSCPNDCNRFQPL